MIKPTSELILNRNEHNDEGDMEINGLRDATSGGKELNAVTVK